MYYFIYLYLHYFLYTMGINQYYIYIIYILYYTSIIFKKIYMK